MREIRFRGKEHTGEWITGGFVQKRGVPHIVAHIVDRGVDEWRAIPVIPATVGQYTGLHDKNGVEIYEGDILQTEKFGKDDGQGHNFSGKENFQVVFEHGAYRIKHGVRKLLLVDGSYYEVVGSVHDAPELLKGEPSC